MIKRKAPARHKVTRNGKTFWRGKGAAVRAAMPRLDSLTNGDLGKSKSMFLEEFFSNPSRKGQFNDIDDLITYDHLSGGSETPTPKQKAMMLSAAKKDSAALKKQGIKHKIHNDQLGAHIKILNSNSSTVKPSKARVKKNPRKADPALVRKYGRKPSASSSAGYSNSPGAPDNKHWS